MIEPFDKVTVKSLTGAELIFAVYTKVPPASVNDGVAVKFKVAKSTSTTLVVTLLATPLMARFSKLPPVAEAIDTVKLSLPSTKPSVSAAMLKLAELFPAGIVTVVEPVISVPFAATPE